jgi:hypothetical protein
LLLSPIAIPSGKKSRAAGCTKVVNILRFADCPKNYWEGQKRSVEALKMGGW